MKIPSKDMCFTEAYIIWYALHMDKEVSLSEKINIILKTVKSYDINIKKGTISIEFIKPIQCVTTDLSAGETSYE